MDNVLALRLVEIDNNNKNNNRIRRKYLTAISTNQKFNTE